MIDDAVSEGIRCMQRVRFADEGVIGEWLTEDGQTAAVQGQSGDRRNQHNRLVVDQKDDLRGGDVICPELPDPPTPLPEFVRRETWGVTDVRSPERVVEFGG